MTGPGRLRIIVGVHIHEAGRDQSAAGVDFLPAGAHVRTNGNNTAIIDGDVSLKQCASTTVRQGSAFNHERYTSHGNSPLMNAA